MARQCCVPGSGRRISWSTCCPVRTLWLFNAVAVCVIVVGCTSSSVEGVSSSWFGSLGPSSWSNSDSCKDPPCPDNHMDSNEGHGGFVPPQENSVQFETEGNLEAETRYEVASMDQDKGMLSTLSSSVTGAFSTASDYVTEKVYKKAANATQDFAEKVREVFHQELYGFMESVGGRLWELLLSPDTLLGVVLKTYGSHALSISLIVVVIIVNYILLQFFSFLTVLSLDCSILLLHRIFGPMWIYSKMFLVGQYGFSLVTVLARYPYVSAALIVILFLLSMIIPIVRWSTKKRLKDRVDTIEGCVSRTTLEVDTIKQCVMQVKDILQRVEARQKEMEEKQQEMEVNQGEILRLLRELKT